MTKQLKIDDGQSDGSEDGLNATPETVRVRQGVTGHNVRYVLGISLAAVVVGMLTVAVYVGWM